MATPETTTEISVPEEDEGEDQNPPPKIDFRRQFIEAGKSGLYLTFFESNPNCWLDTGGHSARVYWFWKSEQCLPMYFQGKFSKQFYRLNDASLAFGCTDDQCERCHHSGLKVSARGECNKIGQATSYHFGAPNINLWFGNKTTATPDLISNVFYSEACDFNATHVKPQWLSSHTNLGPTLGSEECKETATKSGHLALSGGNDFVQRVMRECGDEPCADCGCRGLKG